MKSSILRNQKGLKGFSLVILYYIMKRTTIIKLIQKHLEETNSPQKPLLETYSYTDLKKVLSLYNIQPITDDKNENKNI